MEIFSDLIEKRFIEYKNFSSKTASFNHQLKKFMPPGFCEDNNKNISQIFFMFLKQRENQKIKNEEHTDNHSDHADHHFDTGK